MVSCSDATPTRGGVVSATVSKTVARGFYEFSDKRGRHVRLGQVLGLRSEDDGVGVDELDLKSSELRGALPQGLVECVRSTPWEVSFNNDFKESAHVNLQEMRAAHIALKQAVNRTHEPQRVLNGVDSQVVLCAIAKGRSASFKLNSLLRSSMAWQMVGRKKFGVFYINTKGQPC